MLQGTDDDFNLGEVFRRSFKLGFIGSLRCCIAVGDYWNSPSWIHSDRG